MKLRLASFAAWLLAGVGVAFAQVRVAAPAEAGFEARLREFVSKIRAVDTHEHLMGLAGLKAHRGYRSQTPDFGVLFNVYASEDLKSACPPRCSTH